MAGMAKIAGQLDVQRFCRLSACVTLVVCMPYSVVSSLEANELSRIHMASPIQTVGAERGVQTESPWVPEPTGLTGSTGSAELESSLNPTSVERAEYEPSGMPSVGSALPAEVALVQPYPGQWTLDGRDIACCTARNWTPAKVLRARARTIVESYSDEDECSQAAARALAVFLHMQANHQEDIGAASALRAYYTRIAIQEHLELAQDSLSLVDEELEKQATAQKGGLVTGTDLSSFERQKIEIRDQQLQLHSQDRQLRSLLAQLAKVDYAMSDVRQEKLEVIHNTLNCARLQQVAIATRHDIRGWAYLAQQTNETSAPVFAKSLPTIIGGFGLPIPTMAAIKAMLCPPDYSAMAANMKQELNLTVETHRRWICQAVDEKCHKVELAYQRIELAREVIESWQGRLQQLAQVDTMGQGDPEQAAMARAGLLKARSEEISRRLEARIAEVDLAESTGLFTCRCCNGQPWLLTGQEAY